jgi:IMP dehydrogenase
MRRGVTFSDILLVPKRTPLESRAHAKVNTQFTKNLALNIPLVSSNMATVTEHKMAIAMAREGGLGIIHQFNTVDEQAAQIRKVKKSTTYIIDEPVTITSGITVLQAKQVMKKEGVTSLLVEDNKVLVGIFTHRDYLFETDLDKKVKDVMTTKLITAPYGVTLHEAKKILHRNRIEKLPLLKNKQLKGLITTQDLIKLEHWPNATRDKKGRLCVGAAVGVKDSIQRAQALINAGVDVLVLDVAHAHSDTVIKKLKELKKAYSIDIMVGNVATAQAAQDLIQAGADGLKVGIGPSQVCTTRIISGSGVPQITAIMDVCTVAHKHNIPVSADGGMKYPGDAVKALAAGASTVYSGTFFAGTDEAPGLIILKDGKRYKRYKGSASYASSHERKEIIEKKRVRQKLDVFVEGVEILVDYKGPAEEVIKSLLKGIRSGISYCGAHDIKEMQQNAEFIEMSSKGWHESQSRGDKLSE